MHTLVALFITLTLYALLTASVLGWGCVVAGIIGLGDRKKNEAPSHSLRAVLDKVWLGWCLLLILLQLCHFMMPLEGGVSLAIYGTGLILALFFLRRDRGIIPESALGNLRHYGTLTWIGLAVLIGWIALRAMKVPTDFDSGLYHFGSVRWINEYAIVPGLGNLHNRLAFNCSYFPFVASLNFYPWFGHGSNIALSWLLVLVMVECWLAGARVCSAVKREEEMVAADILPALLVPYLIFVASVTDLSSPQPNRASFILRLVVFICLWRNLTAVDKTHLSTSARMLLVLAVTLVTVKVNNGMYSATACLIVLVRSWMLADGYSLLSLVRRHGMATALGVVSVGTWVVYGYITSGYPLFPSTALALSADWTVWQGDAHSAMRCIYSWARQPFTDADIVLRDSKWIFTWTASLVVYGFTSVLLPVVIFLLVGLRFFHVLCRRGYRELPSLHLYAGLLPLLAGLVFWFKTAPDARFGEGLFWLLPAAVLSANVFEQTNALARNKALITAMLVMALSLLFNWSTALQEATMISQTGWQAPPVLSLVEKTTDSGLKLYIAGTPTQQVWDSPLPGTPYFRKTLQLRGEGLQSGFKTCREIQY